MYCDAVINPTIARCSAPHSPSFLEVSPCFLWTRIQTRRDETVGCHGTSNSASYSAGCWLLACCWWWCSSPAMQVHYITYSTLASDTLSVIEVESWQMRMKAGSSRPLFSLWTGLGRRAVVLCTCGTRILERHLFDKNWGSSGMRTHNEVSTPNRSIVPIHQRTPKICPVSILDVRNGMWYTLPPYRTVPYRTLPYIHA